MIDDKLTTLDEFIGKYQSDSGGHFDTCRMKLADYGVTSVDDLRYLTVKDLCSAGFKLVQARQMLEDLGVPHMSPGNSAPAMNVTINVTLQCPCASRCAKRSDEGSGGAAS